MKIAAIHLKDFKSYKGVHKIEGLDQGLSNKKNIILFGGLNGAGKTSLLEAVTLCFYGEGAEKLFPSKGAMLELYPSFICSLLNKTLVEESKRLAVEQTEKLYVEIFLKEVNISRNVSRDISIRREWIIGISNSGTRLIKEDWQILDNQREHFLALDMQRATSSEYEDRRKEYTDLINEMLPYDISQFFFFDGEKIQEFAADADEKFEKSLKDVLRIGLYDKLHKDLKEVKAKIIRDNNKNKEARIKLAEKEAQKAAIIGQIDTNIEELRGLDDEIEELIVKEERIKYEAKRITNVDADSSSDFKQKRIKLEDRKEVLKSRYLELSKMYMPFLLTYDLCKEVEQQLDQ